MFDSNRKTLVFTDLDGTLLDHHDYSFGPVLPVLEKLAELGIPVIANTSKTRAEWLHLREHFENKDAFVVENGSAIIFPDGECVVFGERRERILDILKPLRERYRFEGFADWGLAGIVAKTGLDRESAKRSADREFSEPLVWKGSEEEKAEFRRELHEAGLNTLEGGRFLHVLGKTDKGKALRFMRGRHEAPVTIIALGDGRNDIAMLEAADIGIVIASPTGKRLELPPGSRVLRSALEGPHGWAETMGPLVEEFSIQAIT